MKKIDVLAHVEKLRNEANEIAMNLDDPARAERHLVALQDAIRDLESSANSKPKEEVSMGVQEEKEVIEAKRVPDIKHYEELINKHVQAKKEEADKKQEQEALKLREYLDKLNALRPRIADLVKLGQLCLKNKLDIGLGVVGLGSKKKENDFFADGVNHTLGFWYNYPVRNVYDLVGVGICGGGWDGPVDLVVIPELDKCVLAVEHGRRYEHKITTRDISTVCFQFFERFLNEFDAFEERFHNYLEGLNW